MYCQLSYRMPKKLKDAPESPKNVYMKKDQHPLVRRELNHLYDVVKSERDKAENHGRAVEFDKELTEVRHCWWGGLPALWWTMVSPTQLRWRCHGLPLYQHCTVVCVAVLCQHWLEWWRAACSVPGHHPSQRWYTINWIPDWILMC